MKGGFSILGIVVGWTLMIAGFYYENFPISDFGIFLMLYFMIIPLNTISEENVVRLEKRIKKLENEKKPKKVKKK